MTEEAAFLQAVRAAPDEDVHRLVFADWLEERGDSRGQKIRLSCQLDPHRDRFEDEAINALRQTVEELLREDRVAERQWLAGLGIPRHLCHHVGLEWRRGFVDTIALPVQWLLKHGAKLRDRYPLLRKLVLFRLNGWGERLAGCESLRGIREIELACWYGDADAAAVAGSPHLGDIDRLTLWWGGGLEQARLFARGAAWPRLRELHLVTEAGPEEEWVRAVNEAAGRPLATVHDFAQDQQLFPFQADFGHHYGYIVGRLPGGEQLFAWGDASRPDLYGWVFDGAGARIRPFDFQLPPALVLFAEVEEAGDGQSRWQGEEEILSARKAYLAEQMGFVPALIRVEEFHVTAPGMSFGPTYDIEDGPLECWGERDDPDFAPEDASGVSSDGTGSGGAGQAVYDAVQSNEFNFWNYEARWVCDRSGRVVYT